MNKIYAFIVSTLMLIVPLLTGLAWVLGWSIIVKALFLTCFIVEWFLIVTVVQMFSERREST